MKYIVADAGGVNIGEPRASNRTLTIGVSTVETASFRILSSDPLWDQVAAGDTTLKVFDSGGNLCFYGPIVSDEEVGNGQGATVQVSAASIAWNLGKRFIGKDTTGVGTTYTSQDPATIIASVIVSVNGEKATGITIGTVDTFVAQTTTFLWKRVLDALNELGAVAGSYEWEIGYTDGTPPTCVLNLRSQLGSDRSSTIYLEYGAGTRGNCAGYRRARSVDQSATRVWALGNGSTLVSTASDAAAETTHRYEDVITFGSISSAAMLDALSAAHVAVRKQPRVLVGLTPFAPTAPRFGVDWRRGDLISARVVVNGSVRVSGVGRIWGASIQVDELGNEKPTLQLEPQ